MPQTEEERIHLLEKANSLPLCPGVYIMRDRSGKVIYVGKSRKLKNRVSQYFQNGGKNIKTARMVANVAEFDYFLCDNEMEALSLENSLIKEHTPKYNIRLKDAKSYPYIKLTAEEYPRLCFTRSREGDKGRYFGPYSGTATVHSLMELVSKTLGMPTCKRSFPRDIGVGRPCIYYQMHQCVGVCTGNVSPTEYRETVKLAVDMLSGKNGQVEKQLEKLMNEYAESERYEAAARCRDTIRALQKVSEKQKVVSSPDTEQDVIALYSDDFCSCVSVFYIRSGILQDKEEFFYGADSILEPSDMTAFLCNHYKERAVIPKEILLSFPLDAEDYTVMETYLSGLAGRKITVRTPEKGERRTLCEMVEKNAAEKAVRYRIENEQKEGTLLRLANLLQLECYPERIEAYDITNLGKEHLNAGMIVVKDGKFSKSDYRSFKIGTVDGTDDYASMTEALRRRFAHLNDAGGSFSELPDLILLDGGKGHVSVIKNLFDELGVSVPVFGMVKDDFHKTRALTTESEEISIAREQDIFTLIYKIQEEVHRFTVSKMEHAKRKTLKTSVLTSISGIGESKAKKLLSHFGGIGKVKEASPEELKAVSGISEKDANAVYRYFQEKRQDGKGRES